MKVLVLGANGQLGLSLRDHLSGTDHEVVYASREQIDVTDLEEVEEKAFKYLDAKWTKQQQKFESQ